MKYPEIYRLSLEEAKEKGEIELYRASHKLNIACKEGIEQAIRENFDGRHLGEECLRPVMERFGPDRVGYVLANTVRQKNYDGRFSRRNKEWAATVHFPPSAAAFSGDRVDFVVETHPAVLDGFIDMARKEMEALREGKERQSVKDQLSAAPVHGKGAADKTKDRGAR